VANVSCRATSVFTTLSRYRKPVPNVTETQDFEGSGSTPQCLELGCADYDALLTPLFRLCSRALWPSRTLRITLSGGLVTTKHAHR
jgi:hypothetical protein